MQNVGYVLITYGVVDALCSATFGSFIKKVGRVPIFIGGAVLNIICVIVLFEWTPNADNPEVFFIIAALWGAADAVWQTQINGKQKTSQKIPVVKLPCPYFGSYSFFSSSVWRII